MQCLHVPVMLKEVVKNLKPKLGDVFVDGTVGCGGHAKEICSNLKNTGMFIGIDVDNNAIDVCKKNLKNFTNVFLVNDSFFNIDIVLTNLGIKKINGVILDLGFSSLQLDDASRGFSYKTDGPLDMRMNTLSAFCAFDVVNFYNEEDLMNIFFDYGEERFSRKIARNIILHRSLKAIKTTSELVKIVKESIPQKIWFQSKKHPARKVFQAIRMEVNGELRGLEKAIKVFLRYLENQNYMAIITFHSLEDKIVKKVFNECSSSCVCPNWFPVCKCNNQAKFLNITKKPITPSNEETISNKRSKSAKLRIIKKIS